MFIVYSYFVYLAISLTVTVWLARTLHRRGRVFLVDAFQGQEDLADSAKGHLTVIHDSLSRPALLPFAPQAFTVLSANRHRVSKWLDWLTGGELQAELRNIHAPGCHGTNPQTTN